MRYKHWLSCVVMRAGLARIVALLSTEKTCAIRWQQRFSSAPHASKENVSLNLPANVLPSREFIAGLKRSYERDKLARLLSEMEVLYEISTEVPRTLCDDDWELYFNLQDINERERFLTRLYYEQLNAVRIAQQRSQSDVIRRKISEEQRILHDRGEMVYAPGFHTFFDIRGQYFRKLVDCMYGSRLLAAERCDEVPPRLIVDCRFLHQLSDSYQSRFLSQMQKLHDANWFSWCPFPVSIVNLLADDRLARYIKRYWLFLYGPKRVHNDEEEDDFSQLFEELDGNSDSYRLNSGSVTSAEGVFTRHPFIPTISSRSIRENLPEGICDEEIAYISSSATRLLDGPLTNYKAIVICSSYDLQPWSSSLSAARSDRLTPYRIPFDRYVKWERGHKVMPINVTANIIRSVYSSGGDWKSAILKNVPEFHFTKDQPTAKHHRENVTDIERKNRLKALEEAILEMDRRRIDALANNEPRKIFAKEQFGSTNRTRRHRYSREERRARINSEMSS